MDTQGGTAVCDIVLSGPMLVANAAEIRGRLVAALEQPGDVRVDAGGVEAIDTAGLQLALALVGVCAHEGRVLEWTSVSETARTAAADLGVRDALAWG
ncbi:MAG: STAS domain-containing protein [Ectothiorhodospiraceae bacterium]|nr:STAS domain-containing protein [Chromatiales bacterium]MCP5154764.1 STAS domain-containing protein [Ectothiorhodospiraceae bacterium]